MLWRFFCPNKLVNQLIQNLVGVLDLSAFTSERCFLVPVIA